MASRRKSVIDCTDQAFFELDKIIKPKNDEQKNLLETIDNNVITFIDGPAGSGKTLLAIYYGVKSLFEGKFANMTLSRVTLEACGERIGFLPGNSEMKLEPYMIPMFDSLSLILSDDQIKALLNKNGKPAKIRILPMAFMRGVTFRSSYVMLDEPQNATIEQIHMLLTRVGYGSKIVMTGDTSQSDMGRSNGHRDAMMRFEDVAKLNKGIGIVRLTKKSIVRHPIIELIEEAYEKKQDFSTH